MKSYAIQNAAIRYPCICLGAIIVVQAVALGIVACQLSATPDEYPNLNAGLVYHELGRFELYCVNPPLIKILASYPSRFLPLRPLKQELRNVRRPEFDAGLEFAKLNGKLAETGLIRARWVSMSWTLVGTLGVFLLGKQVLNSRCGLISAAIWAMSPLTLSYGALLSFDVAAAAVGTLAIFTIVKWISSLTMLDAFSASVTIAVAVLVKSTWLLFLFLLPFASIAFYIRDAIEREHRQDRRTKLLISKRGFLQIVMILLVSVGLINATYRFQGTGRFLGQFSFLSESLRGSDDTNNRFRGTLLTNVPIPFPAAFIEGLDLQKSDFELQRPAYRFGQWNEGGVWYYYVLGYFCKSPIGMILLSIGGILAATGVWSNRVRILSNSKRKNARILGLIFIPMLLLFLVSAQTGMNDHFRYVIIIHGFTCVLAGLGFCVMLKTYPGRYLVALCLLSIIIAPLSSFPFCHVFSNELLQLNRTSAGEMLGGSAADWHQGWWAARKWIQEKGPQVSVWIYTSRWSDPKVHGIPSTTLNNTIEQSTEVYLLISQADRQSDRLDGLGVPQDCIGGTIECYLIRPHDLFQFVPATRFMVAQ